MLAQARVLRREMPPSMPSPPRSPTCSLSPLDVRRRPHEDSAPRAVDALGSARAAPVSTSSPPAIFPGRRRPLAVGLKLSRARVGLGLLLADSTGWRLAMGGLSGNTARSSDPRDLRIPSRPSCSPQRVVRPFFDILRARDVETNDRPWRAAPPRCCKRRRRGRVRVSFRVLVRQLRQSASSLLGRRRHRPLSHDRAVSGLELVEGSQ